MSPARLTGLTVAGLVVAVLGVKFALAISPAIRHEQQTQLDEACFPLAPTASNPLLGRFPRPAPDFQAQDYTGKMVNLSAYRGKVVLLNFWASWCPPCVQEMPAMDKLQRRFSSGAGGDLVVLAVSSDDSWQDIRDFFDTGTAMTVLWDPAAAPQANGAQAGSKVGALSMAYGTDKLPESYLIDRDGNIRYYVVNTRDWDSPDAQRCIRRLLEE